MECMFELKYAWKYVYISMFFDIILLYIVMYVCMYYVWGETLFFFLVCIPGGIHADSDELAHQPAISHSPRSGARVQQPRSHPDMQTLRT